MGIICSSPPPPPFMLEKENPNNYCSCFIMYVVVAGVKALLPFVEGQKLSDIYGDFASFWRKLTSESQLRWVSRIIYLLLHHTMPSSSSSPPPLYLCPPPPPPPLYPFPPPSSSLSAFSPFSSTPFSHPLRMLLLQNIKMFTFLVTSSVAYQEGRGGSLAPPPRIIPSLYSRHPLKSPPPPPPIPTFKICNWSCIEGRVLHVLTDLSACVGQVKFIDARKQLCISRAAK